LELEFGGGNSFETSVYANPHETNQYISQLYLNIAFNFELTTHLQPGFKSVYNVVLLLLIWMIDKGKFNLKGEHSWKTW